MSRVKMELDLLASKEVAPLDSSEEAHSPREAGDVRDEFASQLRALRDRAQCLPASQRALALTYLDGGRSLREIARLAGVSETTAARRVRRLTRRLTDRHLLLVLHRAGRLTEQQQAAAQDYFLDGLRRQAIGRKRGLSVAEVRRLVSEVQRTVLEISKSAWPQGRGARRVRIRE